MFFTIFVCYNNEYRLYGLLEYFRKTKKLKNNPWIKLKMYRGQHEYSKINFELIVLVNS